MKTVREGKAGEVLLRLVATKNGFTGVAFLKGALKAKLEGSDADDVWRRLHDEAAKLSPDFVGFAGARSRFLRMMPGGFADPVYIAQERAYKLRAKAKLDALLPLAQALTWSGNGEGALAGFRATNLLSPFENTRMQEALRSPAAIPFIRGAAIFAEGDVNQGLRDMDVALRPFEIAKWTAVTYLPFLWRPDAHMFLKPEVTRAFAARVGHRFDDVYSPDLRSSVYQALIDLAETTERETADLHPVDRIDIQSFVWVVGKYTAEDEAALKRL